MISHMKAEVMTSMSRLIEVYVEDNVVKGHISCLMIIQKKHLFRR